MDCPQCDQEIEYEQNFCPKCGFAIGPDGDWLDLPEYMCLEGICFRLIRPGSFVVRGCRDYSWTFDGGSRELVSLEEESFLRCGDFSPASDNSDRPPKKWVTLGKPFYMGITAVTQEQYQKITGENPSGFPENFPKDSTLEKIKKKTLGDNKILRPGLLPVESVTWEDADRFCKKLSDITGRCIHLPTEAQWEYACRAGSNTAYFFGTNKDVLEHFAHLVPIRKYDSSPCFGKGPIEARFTASNGWGLRGMLGNVNEWCLDEFGDDSELRMPKDGSNYVSEWYGSSRHVCRGDSWRGRNDGNARCNCYYRPDEDEVYACSDDVGFRICVSLNEGDYDKRGKRNA